MDNKMKKDLNAAIFGYSKNAEVVLDFLINKKVKTSFVCFPKNAPANKVDKIRAMCQKSKIYYFNYDPKRLLKEIGFFKVNLALVASFPHILNDEIINQPKYGIINLHGSLLPKYRGANPVNWVLINGESETGVTLHYVDKGIDTGNIIAQKKILIDIHDDAFVLRDKIYQAGKQLLGETWDLFIQDKVNPVFQTDNTATYYRKREPGDGRVIWSLQATEIYNLIRALVFPWPGAYCFYKKNKIIIEKVSVKIDNRPHFRPGKILKINDNKSIEVSTGYNLTVIEKIRNEELFNKLELHEGDYFD